MNDEQTDGQLKTAQVYGAKAIYHDKVNGAEPQMSPWFRGQKRNKTPRYDPNDLAHSAG